MKTLKFKLYNHKRNKYLKKTINAAGVIYNHGHILDELDLSVRRWPCPSCQSENDQDENASVNIKMVGSSTIGIRDVR